MPQLERVIRYGVQSLAACEMLKVKADASKFILPLNPETLKQGNDPAIVRENPNIGTEEEPLYEYADYKGKPLNVPIFKFDNPVDCTTQLVSLGERSQPIMIVNDVVQEDALQLKDLVQSISLEAKRSVENWRGDQVSKFLEGAALIMTHPQVDAHGRVVRDAQKNDVYDSDAFKLQQGLLGFEPEEGQSIDAVPSGVYRGRGSREAVLVRFPERGSYSIMDRREKQLGGEVIEGARYMAVVRLADKSLRAIQLDEFLRTHVDSKGGPFSEPLDALKRLPIVEHSLL